MALSTVFPRVSRARSTIACTFVALLGSFAAPAAQAAQPLIVSNDNGGSVMERFQEISTLRIRQTPVEVRGRCMSSCTMYLGLSQTCVTPGAVLGFHGPRQRGTNRPMVNSAAAELMAAHYPPALRTWYMREGQYIAGDRVARISGSQLIAMGVPRCRG